MSLFMSPGKQPTPFSPSRPEVGRAGDREADRGVHELFVPGRVCLFGEHSDWAGSFTRFNADITPGVTVVSGTNQGLYARVKRHPSSLILTTTTDGGETVGPFELDLEPSALLRVAQEGCFWSYAAGVAYKICVDYRVGGLEVFNYRTDLPMRKGLSSSAAFCVLLARAFNQLYDIKMTLRGEMEYAYQGELSTPSRCGRMDQGCAYGNRPIVMRYDGEFVGLEPLQLRGPPLHYVVVDLAGSKSTTEILASLQAGYPFPRDDTARGVHELLGPINKRICEAAIRQLQEGDGRALGALMGEAQEAWDRLGVPACPAQLAAPLLHKVLRHPALQPHIWGGKGVGSQGDGTAQLLARSAADQTAVQDIISRDFGMESLSLTLRPSTGVRKAVIPAAGFSSALYPASKALKTEMFPVLDADGRTKPAILLHVEELVAAGVEEVIIVCQQEDVSIFERLFHQPDTHQNFSKLPAASRSAAKNLLDVGERVRLLVQPAQEGFGHALFCAKEAVGDAPFLLLIGHHVYRSTTSTSVAAQLLEAFTEQQCSVVSLMQTHIDEVHHFGTVCGTWIREHRAERGEGGGASGDGQHSNLVERTLAELGLSQYSDRFAAERLLYSQLPALTNEELKDMGIPLGPRKMMLANFAQLAETPLQRGAPSGDAMPSALRIHEVAEKPTKAYAQDNLVMTNPSLKRDHFLTMFGQYVLTPEIFRHLEEDIKNNVRHSGQFQLTPALDSLRKQQGLVGVCVKGRRFNIGTPEAYLQSLVEMSKTE